MSQLKSIIEKFCIQGEFAEATEYGSGHIHDTYFIRTTAQDCNQYLLQKINHSVFKRIPELMVNIERVTKHIQLRLKELDESEIERKCLTLISTIDDGLFYADEKGSFWRVYLFIDNSMSIDTVEDKNQAFVGGRAFGSFLNFLADLPASSLNITIPNFHNVAMRLDAFVQILKKNPSDRAKWVIDEIEFILERENEMRAFRQLESAGYFPERITHNDTKINNVLFDQEGNDLCVIDLDTVMPGFTHYDFGDCVRTMTNTADEDEKNTTLMEMDIHLFEALANGYIAGCGNILTKNEIEHFVFAGKLLSYLMGVRFLTDYLDGDRYYKIGYSEHNLVRARTQLKMCQSIEEQSGDMWKIIDAHTQL